jgi:CRISPR/Cas system-associated endoribonuclease Cas2
MRSRLFGAALLGLFSILAVASEPFEILSLQPNLKSQSTTVGWKHVWRDVKVLKTNRPKTLTSKAQELLRWQVQVGRYDVDYLPLYAWKGSEKLYKGKHLRPYTSVVGKELGEIIKAAQSLEAVKTQAYIYDFSKGDQNSKVAILISKAKKVQISIFHNGLEKKVFEKVITDLKTPKEEIQKVILNALVTSLFGQKALKPSFKYPALGTSTDADIVSVSEVTLSKEAPNVEPSVFYGFNLQAPENWKLQTKNDLTPALVQLDISKSSLTLERIVNGTLGAIVEYLKDNFKGDVQIVRNESDLHNKVSKGFQSEQQQQKLTHLRGDFEKALLSGAYDKAAATLAIESFLKVFEQELYWETLPNGYRSKEDLTTGLKGLIQKVHSFGLSNVDRIHLVDQLFNPQNPQSILNASGYVSEKGHGDYIILKKQVQIQGYSITFYLGYMKNRLVRWVEVIQ